MAITFSPQLQSAAAALSNNNNKKIDLPTLFLMLGQAAYDVEENKGINSAKRMAQNVGLGELANKAKTGETKAMAMLTDKKVGATDKLSSKTLSAADKKELNDLADSYQALGINGEYLSKIRTGDITKSELEAMVSATKGKADSITSQQTMDNMDVTKISNFLSNMVNLMSKMLETIKTNAQTALR
jgi:hypothetical protein